MWAETTEYEDTAGHNPNSWAIPNPMLNEARGQTGISTEVWGEENLSLAVTCAYLFPLPIDTAKVKPARSPAKTSAPTTPLTYCNTFTANEHYNKKKTNKIIFEDFLQTFEPL